MEILGTANSSKSTNMDAKFQPFSICLKKYLIVTDIEHISGYI
jgi:hypothetical protein